MKTLEQINNEIVSIIEDMKLDILLLEKKKMKTAAVRLRKRYQKVRKLSLEARVLIQELKPHKITDFEIKNIRKVYN